VDEYDLLQQAREILPFAYAPYSGYRVGAALLTADGRVFRGTNVENASLGLTICAERTAAAAAVSAGCRTFVILAVTSTGGEQVPFPCGACRQVLREFSEDLKIIAAGEKGRPFVLNLRELLPYTFGVPGAGEGSPQE